MPTDGWLAGWLYQPIKNRFRPRRPQLGFRHRAPVAKLLLHTTEGATISGALAAYRARAGAWVSGVHPHGTVDPQRRIRLQHVPLTKASYGLRRGGGDGIIQIEIIGRAADTPNWPADWLDWLGTEVIAPILEACPLIPPAAPYPFLGPEAGLLAAPWPQGRARIDPALWPSTQGIIGHQHAPWDAHWDPGRLNVARLLTAAAERTPTPYGDDMIYHFKAGYLAFYWIATAGTWSAITTGTAETLIKAGHPTTDLTSDLPGNPTAIANGLRKRLARWGRLDESTAPWTAAQTAAVGLDPPYGDTVTTGARS